MTEIFKYFDKSKCSLFLEAFRNKDLNYPGSEMEKIRDIEFKNAKLKYVDIRTSKILDIFINWLIELFNSNSDIISDKKTNDDIFEFIYEYIVNDFLPKTLKIVIVDDALQLFIEKIKTNPEVKKLCVELFDTIKFINTHDEKDKWFVSSTFYYHAATFLYFVVDIYTIMLIEKAKKNISVIWMGGKHIQSILSYYVEIEKNWDIILGEEFIHKIHNIKSKCININPFELNIQ